MDIENEKSKLLTYVKTRLAKDVVECLTLTCIFVGAAVITTVIILVVQEKIHPTPLEEKISLTQEYIAEGQAELARLQAE